MNVGLPVGGYPECALHIAGPLRAGEANLLLGRAQALQEVAAQPDAALACNDMGQRAD